MVRSALIALGLIACSKTESKPAPKSAPAAAPITIGGATLAVPDGFTTADRFADKQLLGTLQKLLGADATLLISTTPAAGSVIGISVKQGDIGSSDADCARVGDGIGAQVNVPVKAQVFASPKPAGCLFTFTRLKLAPELLYYLQGPPEKHIVIECIGAAEANQMARDLACAGFAGELATK